MTTESPRGVGDLFAARPETVGEGRYVLQGRIGSGGVAEVFSALDTKYDTECAVKVMEVPRGAQKPVGVRFLGEAKVMSRMRHPNVPRVYDAGREGGWYWFVMDLAKGSVAQHVYSQGPFAPLDALRLTHDVLAALVAVHALGLVHRDIKPENVLLSSDGRGLLADFGIARHPEGSVPVHTRPGELMGTRGYRAPEQEDDAHGVLPTADLYGVSATLYCLVIGKPPIRLWSDDGRSMIPTHIDEEIAALIRGGTHFDPAERYGDAHEMAVAVAKVADAYAPDDARVSTQWMERLDSLLEPKTPSKQPGGWKQYLPRWLADRMP